MAISTNTMKKRKSKMKEISGKKLFLMTLPFLIIIFIFSYVPLFGWSFAFFDYKAGHKLYGYSIVHNLVYLLPAMVSPFNLVLCKTYIESIPPSLEESAEIDGAGYFIRFTRIIFPLIKPIIATIAVFSIL